MLNQLSRRDFLARSAGAALGAGLLAGLPRGAFAARTGQAADFFEWTEISRGVFVALNRTGGNLELAGGNSTLFVDDAGSLIVDVKQALLGNTLKRELTGRTPKLGWIVNTHHHFDHAGGNPCFGGTIPFTMHANCEKRLLESGASNVTGLDKRIEALRASGLPGAEAAATDAGELLTSLPTLPQDAWAPKGRTTSITAQTSLKAAGRTLTLHSFGPGHTDNDIVVHDADANIVLGGDVLFNGLHVFFDVAGGAKSAGWLHSLAEIKKLCNAKTIVVPGHGSVGDVTMIDRLAEYFEKTIAAVKQAIKDGKPREEVAKMILPEYKDFALGVAQPYLWGGIYDELVPPTTDSAQKKGAK